MTDKLKYFWQQSWLVICASFVFGVLLAITSAALSPRIEQNRIQRVSNLMRGLIPEARFEPVAELTLEEPVRGAYQSTLHRATDEQDQTLGWLFDAQGAGFADIISLIVAVDADFEQFIGFSVLASAETPGFGDQIYEPFYQNQFAGAPADQLELVRTGDPQQIDRQIVTITGATISSQAVVDIINRAREQIETHFENGEFIGHGQ